VAEEGSDVSSRRCFVDRKTGDKEASRDSRMYLHSASYS